MNWSNNLRLLKLTHVGAGDIRAVTGSGAEEYGTPSRSLLTAEGEMYPYDVGLLFLYR